MLQQCLAELVETEDAKQREVFDLNYLNEPKWDEPVTMVAEEIGHAGDPEVGVANIERANVLIDGALRVDPLFAARLARLCGSAISPQLRGELNQRFRSLYAADNSHYRQVALAAMLASGWDDFADILIPLLTNADQQLRLRTYRAGPDFQPSSLGSRWEQVVSGWPEQMREEFVSELTIHQRNRSGISLRQA
jgi:hypothetical protein